MAQDNKPPRGAEPTPATPPPDDPLRRGAEDEPIDREEARAAALARLKALEELQRMEKEANNP